MPHPVALTAVAGTDADVAARIERSFRVLGRRVYGVGPVRTGIDRVAIDRVGVFLLGALENEDLRPSDLASAVELELSTISRRLSRLEDAHLIRRRTDPDDGRVHRISLTSAGRDALDQARAARAAILDEAFRGWDLADRIQLLHLLDRLSADLDRSTTVSTPPTVSTAPTVSTSLRKSTA